MAVKKKIINEHGYFAFQAYIESATALSDNIIIHLEYFFPLVIIITLNCFINNNSQALSYLYPLGYNCHASSKLYVL